MVKGIVEQLQQEHDWKQVTDRRVKKYIPGLLQELGLIEITANNVYKDKYKLDFMGYPKIIIPISDRLRVGGQL